MRPLLPIVSTILLALGGCASASDDADTQASAVSPEEAIGNERFEVQRSMLANEPAGGETRQTLGIASWTVYAVASRSRDLAGTIAYAVDGAGDVKYAVATMSTFDGASESVAFMELAEDGAKKTLDPSAVTEITKRLAGDLTTLDRKLRHVEAQSTGSARAECAVRLSLIGLGGIAAAFAGVGAMTFGVATAAKAAGATGVVGAIVATLVSLAGAPVGAAAGVSVAVMVSRATDELRHSVWNETLDVCKRAVE